MEYNFDIFGNHLDIMELVLYKMDKELLFMEFIS